MNGLKVIKSGMLTLLQDNGRYGYADIGITQSGVADGYSSAWVNRLLLNESNTNMLEILLGNASFISTVHSYIAVCGAKVELSINGEVKAMWKSHQIKPNDTIEIGMAKSGLRVYLGIKGGFHIDPELGSCATTIKEGFFGKIAPNDMLPCDEYRDSLLTSTPQIHIPEFLDIITLRVVLGYQSDCFEPQEIEKFFSSPYTVSNQTDRMGCRLSGEQIAIDAEIVSEAISFGAIQIPKDGQPIVLLKERQTIGGYPKIGSILPMDCYRLAQARPSTTVTFKEVSLDEGMALTKELYRFLNVNV